MWLCFSVLVLASPNYPLGEANARFAVGLCRIRFRKGVLRGS